MSHPSHRHRRPTSSRSDLRSTYSHASASSSTHAPRDIEMKTNSSSSYWDTVIDQSSPSDYHSAQRSRPISKGSYEEHKASSSSEKPYVCEECGTAFKKNSNLVKHMKLVHRGEKNFACREPGCGRLFGQKSNLNSHIKAVHLGEKPFECNEPGCGKRFSQKSGLKAHIKTVHHRERPFVCDECGSSFGHRGDVRCLPTHCSFFIFFFSHPYITQFEFLTEHYLCLVPSASCTILNLQLNRHIRVLHEKQRPFECPICPEHKAFGRKSVLMRHMQTHQGMSDVVMRDGSSSSHR